MKLTAIIFKLFFALIMLFEYENIQWKQRETLQSIEIMTLQQVSPSHLFPLLPLSTRYA